MRRQVIKFIILLFVMLLFAGCRKNDFTSSGTMILFQYDHSIGNTHQGYIIDSDGNVFTYKIDGNIFPDGELEISNEKADEYLNNFEFTGRKIGQEELKKYAKYIEYIASSKVTAVRDKRDDNTGTTRYICYRFDETRELYTGHIMKMEGSNTSQNLNIHSKKVSSWMREIGNDLAFEE